MTTDPVTPATVRNMTMATSSVVTERGVPPRPVPELKAWTWPPLDAAFRDSRHELRAHGGEPVAGHEFDQVAPVRADVGEGTGWPSEGRVDAPIVVLLRRQPVLQIGAVDEPQRAETGCYPRADLANQRVEAVHEGHRGDDARAFGCGLQVCC